MAAPIMPWIRSKPYMAESTFGTDPSWSAKEAQRIYDDMNREPQLPLRASWRSLNWICSVSDMSAVERLEMPEENDHALLAVLECALLIDLPEVSK